MIALAKPTESAVTRFRDDRRGLSSRYAEKFVRFMEGTSDMEGGEQRNHRVSLNAAVSIDAHGIRDARLADVRDEFERVRSLDRSFAKWHELGEKRTVHAWTFGQAKGRIEVCERVDE